MTILSHSNTNQIMLALFVAVLTSSCPLLGMNTCEEHQTSAQLSHYTAAALKEIGRRNKEFDQSILDAINTILLPTGPQCEVREISNRYMIRDIHDMIVTEYYDNPGLCQDAQLVFDYLYDIQNFAIRNGRLVNRTNPDGNTILHLIAADINAAQTERIKFVYKALIRITQEYNIDSNPSAQLCEAIKAKDLARATQLLNEGTDPNGMVNKKGQLPPSLYFIPKRQYLSHYHPQDMWRQLTINGIFLDLTRVSGNSPLTLADNNFEFISLLLRYGAYVDCKNFLNPALLLTTFFIYNNVSIQDKCHKEFPLHAACKRNSPEFVECLLQQGADVHAIDACGRTPLDVAEDEQRNRPGDHKPAAIVAMLKNVA